MKIVERKITELIKAEYNPRKLSPKAKRSLRESLKKFGMVDPILVNMHPDRKNIIVGGHQRIEQWEGFGNKTIPCVELKLNQAEEKELNLRLNKNHGEFDYRLVEGMFDLDMLVDIGFNESDFAGILSDFEKSLEGIDSENSVYPISPKFDESYNYILIFSETQMDFTWLKNVLEIKIKQDYKSQNLGTCKVLKVSEFQKLYEKWTSQQ